MAEYSDVPVASASIPIVALCASAGGLEAFQAFFENMPVSSGIAFLVVQHQHFQQESILNDIIQRGTLIPVLPMADGLLIERDRIYVLPSAFEVTIWNGRFQLAELQRAPGWPNTIDRFLMSLAHDAGERVIAIILSGAGVDGTQGARTVRENGGLVIAQEPKSAAQEAMPLSVIEAKAANVVLPPHKMPDFLLSALKIDISRTIVPENLADTISEEDLSRIVRRLRRQQGRDYAEYKTSTMRRQTARRMGSLQIDTMDGYLAYMDQHPEEASLLARYLLINVTSFFRDDDAFESLKQNALLPMLRKMDIDTAFRAWVPGCATGEEAVSIAITIYECLRELNMPEMEVRLFATDANRDLMQRARIGFYPSSIVEHVSESRLHDHFSQEENGYRVRNHISRMIIYSEHNLVEHPPFSQLHLISCRNVLIYFQRRLQDRILSLFQFALRPEGILFLGSSETMPFNNDDFIQIDSKSKIYRRATGSSRA